MCLWSQSFSTCAGNTVGGGERERTLTSLFSQIFMKFPVSARRWARPWGYSNDQYEGPALTEPPLSEGSLIEQRHTHSIQCWVATVQGRNEKGQRMERSEGMG